MLKKLFIVLTFYFIFVQAAIALAQPVVSNLGSASSVFGLSIQLSAPAGSASGDLLCQNIQVIELNGAVAVVTGPSNWVKEYDSANASIVPNQQNDTEWCGLYSVVGAGPYTWTVTGTGGNNQFVQATKMQDITSENQTTSLETTQNPNCVNTSAVVPTALSIAVPTANSLVLWDAVNSANFTMGVPTGFTTDSLNVNSNSQTDGHLAFSAATGDQLATSYSGTGGWCATMVVIAPAGGPTPTPTATPTPGPTPTPTATPSPGPFSVASTPRAVYPSVHRVGINLDNQSPYGSEAFMQNYLDNPGFEEAEQGHIITVGAGSNGTQFYDTSDAYMCFGSCTGGGSNEISGHFDGAVASVRSGASAGTLLTVNHYTAGNESCTGIGTGPAPNASSCCEGQCSNNALVACTPGTVATDCNSGTATCLNLPGHGNNCESTYTCSSNGGVCPALVTGDVVAIRIQNTTLGHAALGALPGLWGITNNDPKVTLTTTQKYEGNSSVQFDTSDQAIHEIHFGGDTLTTSVGTCHTAPGLMCNTPGIVDATDCGAGVMCDAYPYGVPMHPIKGPMTISYRAMAAGVDVAPSISTHVTRAASSWGSTATFTDVLPHDNAWHFYTHGFTGQDIQGDTSIWQNYFDAVDSSGTTGSKIYIDDVFFGPTTTTANGGFRTEFLQTLQSLFATTANPTGPPATTRLMVSNASGMFQRACGDANYEGNDFLRGPCVDASPDTGLGFSEWIYSLTDMYAIDAQLGASPWMSIGNVYYDADLNSLAAGLCTAFTAYNFTDAYVEGSNEDWAKSTVNIAGNPYSEVWNRNFGIINTYMTAHCPTFASRVHEVVNGQAGNAGVLATSSNLIPKNNGQFGGDIATYINDMTTTHGGSLASFAAQTVCSGAELYMTLATLQTIPLCAGYTAVIPVANSVPLTTSQGLCGGALANCGTPPNSQFLSFYEGGAAASASSPVTALELYEETAGWMEGPALAASWLLAFKNGSTGVESGTPFPIGVQNVFQFMQIEFPTPVPSAIWGIVTDLDSQFGPAWIVNGGHLRPSAVAMSAFNSIVQSNYYPVDTSTNNSLYAVAFKGATWSAFVSNISSSAKSVTLTFPNDGALIPTNATTLCNSGITSGGLADNNENSTSVTNCAISGGVTTAGRQLTVTIPAYSYAAFQIPTLPCGEQGSNSPIGIWTSGASFTVSITPTIGNAIALQVSNYDGINGNLTSPPISSPVETWTLVKSVQDTTNKEWHNLYIAYNVSSGATHTITLTDTNNFQSGIARATELYGLNGITDPASVSINQSTATTNWPSGTSGTLATTSEVCFAGNSSEFSAVTTPGALTGSPNSTSWINQAYVSNSAGNAVSLLSALYTASATTPCSATWAMTGTNNNNTSAGALGAFECGSVGPTPTPTATPTATPTVTPTATPSSVPTPCGRGGTNCNAG